MAEARLVRRRPLAAGDQDGDQPVERRRGGADLVEVVEQVVEAELARLLHQKTLVAEDRPRRPRQFLGDQSLEGPSSEAGIFARPVHPTPAKSASILPRSRGRSTGLLS